VAARVRDVCRGHVTMHDENLPGMGRGKSSASTLEKEHIQSERKASPDSPNVKENILKPRSVRSVYERGQWMMGSTAARDSVTTEEASSCGSLNFDSTFGEKRGIATDRFCQSHGVLVEHLVQDCSNSRCVRRLRLAQAFPSDGVPIVAHSIV